MTVDSLSVAILVGSISRAGGGVFDSVRQCAIGLIDAGCAVHIYAPLDSHARDDLTAWLPLKPELFTIRGPRAIAYTPGLKRALDQQPSNVLHLHGLWQYLSLTASAWRGRTGRPVIISPHGMLDPWALKNSGWKKRLARLLFEDSNLRGAACLHALNQSEADAMRAFGLPNPIAIIPNGTDLPAEREAYQRPIWLQDDGRQVLLYIGRLHPKKGLRELISAWAILKRCAPQTAAGWRVVIAGWDDGGHARMLHREITAYNLNSDILLPGPVYGAVKSALLSNAGAFILPSYSEGLPIAVLEAWAYKCPVFMTAACHLPKGFEVGAAIEISTDPAEIARTLAAHLTDTNLLVRGQRGRDLVATRFSWNRIAAGHAAVYRWMVDGGVPPASVRLT